MEINDKQQKMLEAAVREFGLLFLVLYGSRARGDAHAESDIDIGYRCSDFSLRDGKERKMAGLSMEKEGRLSGLLEKIFSGPVDLRSLHSENPYFLFSAMKSAQFLAGDTTGFARFQAYAFAVRHDAMYDLDPIREAFRNKRLATL